MKSIVLLLVGALLCATGHCQADDPPLPNLSRYFTGFAEYNSTQGGANSTETLLLVQDFYDEDFQFKRDDFALQSIDNTAGTTGTLSVIEDVGLGVQYMINRHFNNCTINSLYDAAVRGSTFDVVLDSDGHLRLRSFRELLFADVVNYTYKGVETTRGLEVDTWSAFGNFSADLGGIGPVNYTNTLTEVSFTRPGQPYPSLISVSTEPVLLRLLIQGTVSGTYNGSDYTTNFTINKHFFGSSFDEPSFDAFDVSVCSDPSDYRIGTLFITGHVNGLDLGVLRKSIRSTISNYTGLYPIQIGSIEVIGENGTYIFVKFHISNLTSLVRVNNSVTANSAVQMLLANSNNGRLPFEIELAPGNRVTPIFHVHNETRNCPNQVNTTTTVTVTVSPTTTSSTSPTTTGSSSCSVIAVTSVLPNTNCPSPSCTASKGTTTVVTSAIASACQASCRGTTTVVDSNCPSSTSCPATDTIKVTTVLPNTTSCLTPTSTSTTSTSSGSSCSVIAVTSVIPNTNCPAPSCTASKGTTTVVTSAIASACQASCRGTTTLVDSNCLTSTSCPATDTIKVTTVLPNTTSCLTPTSTSGSSSSSCPTTGTVTVTVTPSCPTAAGSQGLSTGPSIGLAFGMFFAGVVLTLLVIVSFVVCRNKMKNGSWNPKSPVGYEKPKDQLEHFN